MDFIDLFRFFLLLIVPGIIAAKLYGFIAHLKHEPSIATILTFDLFIFIINITGLFFFKGIHTMTFLITCFDCLSFTRRYALLSIFVGLILATICGFIHKICCHFRYRRSS